MRFPRGISNTQRILGILTVALIAGLSVAILGVFGSFLSAASGPLAEGTRTSLEGAGVFSLAVDSFDSSIVYAGTGSPGGGAAGSVFKSFDFGASWIEQSLGSTRATVTAIAIHPIRVITVYAGTLGEGVFRSSNGGATWEPMNVGLRNLNVRALVLDPSSPSTLYACTFQSMSGGELTTEGIYRSIDEGFTWTRQSSVPALSLVIDPVSRQTLYAGTFRRGVLKSIDGGETWIEMNFGLSRPTSDPSVLAPPSVPALAIAPGPPTTIYAAASYPPPSTERSLFQSTDGGEHWTAVLLAVPAPGILSLVVDPVAPVVVYAGGPSVWRTADGGATWPLTAPVYEVVQALAINPANRSMIYAGVGGSGVLRSTNFGAKWNRSSRGLFGRPTGGFVVDSR